MVGKCFPYSGSEHLWSVITLYAFAFFTCPVASVSVAEPFSMYITALLSMKVLQRGFRA